MTSRGPSFSRQQEIQLQFYAISNIILWPIITSYISRLQSVQLLFVGDSEIQSVCEQFTSFPRTERWYSKITINISRKTLVWGLLTNGDKHFQTLLWNKASWTAGERQGIKCPVVLRPAIKDMLCIVVIWWWCYWQRLICVNCVLKYDGAGDKNQ